MTQPPVLRPLTPEHLDADQRELYDAILGARAHINALRPLTDDQRALLGPFDPMLRSPAIGRASQQLGLALRHESALPARVTEAAILTTAVHYAAAFEWYAHAAIVRDARLISEADLTHIAAAEAPEDPEIELAWRAATAVLDVRRYPDDIVAKVTGRYGERGLVEITTMVGHYSHLALLMRALGIEPPEPAGEGN